VTLKGWAGSIRDLNSISKRLVQGYPNCGACMRSLRTENEARVVCMNPRKWEEE
jgi:hypothetical protein